MAKKAKSEALARRDDLTHVTDKDLVLGEHFAIGRIGLRVLGDPDFDESAIFGRRMSTAASGIQFAVGDFVNFCERRFGEKASQIIDSDDFAENSIGVYRWVSERVEVGDRRPTLKFEHHKHVAKLNPIEQRKWLDLAENGGDPWTAARLKREMSKGEDGPITDRWLVVLCKDKADQDKLKAELEAMGRVVRVQERHERKSQKPKITARAKGRKKSKGGRRRR